MDLAILLTAYAHVLLAPYSKVEESFNLHATHDVLVYGLHPARLHLYDHFTFPGAVPRSFVASVLLAWLSTPVLRIASHLHIISTKAHILVSLRLVLATLNALGLCLLRRAVSRRFGFSTGLFYTLLTCTQFHLPFWMSRTLPNMFALFPVNIAFSILLNRMPNTTHPSPRATSTALALLTCTAVILRAEIALLLAPLALQSLIWTPFSTALRVGITSALASIAVTLLVDSYFWDTWPLWPELHGLYFNVYQGKSAEWGVSPAHAYITTHIPKLLLSSLPLALVGLAVEPRVRSALLPAAAFVALISALGHKEWRFVIYVVPLCNVAAARGAWWLTRRRTRSLFGRLCVLAVAGLIATNLLATYIMTDVSRNNYPGGTALARLNDIYADVPNVHVHIDNHAAQTGASLFLQVHAPPFLPYLAAPRQRTWVYNKTENLSARAITSARHFTHVVTEAPRAYDALGWRRVEAVDAFDGFRIRRGVLDGKIPVVFPVERLYSEKLWIMERT